MADFSFLDQYDVREKTSREFPFYDIPGKDGEPITLIVSPASEPNKPYFSALTRYAMKNRRTMQNNVNILEETRNLDRRLYAQFVVTGWKYVIDTDGKDVLWSKKECLELMEQLPNHYFDELREFCADLNNFAGLNREDTEAAAKNSPSGSSGNSD